MSHRRAQWELYDIDADGTEMHDLADKNPDVVAKLAKRWQEMAKMDHTTGSQAAPVTDNKPPILKKDGRPEGGDGLGKAKKKGQGKNKKKAK